MVMKQSNKFIILSLKTMLFLNNRILKKVLLEINLQANLWNLSYIIPSYYKSIEFNMISKQY